MTMVKTLISLTYDSLVIVKFLLMVKIPINSTYSNIFLLMLKDSLCKVFGYFVVNIS